MMSGASIIAKFSMSLRKKVVNQAFWCIFVKILVALNKFCYINN